ncbi:hypothetical protein [Amycolatopsis orientalis]|uniref:hypothetical protein n=1 Tax=Amycolatopsis orientalis TaxID=31958 RepID=UPI00041E64A4|nr:hypothetical protein [Amycolatopsis orientalis]
MTRVSDVNVAERSFPESRKRVPRAFVLGIGIVLLSVSVVARVGRFGFNPTDQGFVLAQMWRVLHGELPQVDFLGPRPFGSAYLHLVDRLVPAPLMIGSSFVMMVQLTVATFALAAFLTGTSPLEWGPLRTGLVFTAALVSLNTYPLMAWHTVDGVFLVAVGWWLVDSGLRSDSRWRRWLGLFCIGFAVIVKQSFLFAAPIGLLILLFHPAAQSKKVPRLLGDLLVLGAAPSLYFGMVTVAGGLRSAIAQLSGGQQTWGEGLAVAWSAREHLGEFGRWLRVATATCVAAVVRRRLPWRYLSIAALGWMAALSWGYPFPGLLAGIFALGVLEAVVPPDPPRPPKIAGAALAAVTFVLVALLLLSAHDKAPYADRPQGELTKDPFVAPVFGVRNPFPLDWPLPMELTGDSPERMVEAAERLDREGNYLVLFQTVKAVSLTAGLPVPDAVAPDAPTIALSGVEKRIQEKLTGAKVACGSFVGFWVPAR